jgi:dienelactone hydrolase
MRGVRTAPECVALNHAEIAATEAFGERENPELHELPVDVSIEAVFGLDHRSNVARRALISQELTDQVPKHHLIFVEVELHGYASPFPPDCAFCASA